MSHPGHSRAAAVAMLVPAAALGLIVTLTGCGAGAITQTGQQAAGVNGYAGQAGQILVRDATIAFAGQLSGGAVYRPGQNPDLSMTLVNTGTSEDRLVSVSSPIAGSAQVIGEPVLAAGRSVQVGNNGGMSSTAVADRTIAIRLIGLTQDVRAGLTYPVVLRFERAGELTAQLPVGYPTGQLAERK